MKLKEFSNEEFKSFIKYVKNIISFTGTAYIELPTEQNISYKGDEQIEYAKNTRYKLIEALELVNNKMEKFKAHNPL
jgi:hypothetical protein